MVYTAVTAGPVILQPVPAVLNVTLYAPVVAPPDVVMAGDTFEEPVVVGMSGPFQV